MTDRRRLKDGRPRKRMYFSSIGHEPSTLPNPDPTIGRSTRGTQMNSALGLIETQGLVGLIYAIDAMLKAASVELASSIIKLDGGLVSVMIRGDVSSVRAAVEAGAEAAGRVGELKAAHVIPRPGDTVVALFGGGR